MPEGSVAKAAQCDEWDSDEGSVVPNTTQTAKRHPPQHPSTPYRQPRVQSAAGDLAYPSSAARSPVPPPIVIPAQTVAPPETSAGPARSKAKPVVHRADSSRNTQRAQTFSVPPPPERQRRQCSDPHCRDPKCTSTRNPDRRYTLSQPQQQQQSRQPPPPPAAAPAARYPTTPQYQQIPAYEYAQMSQTQAAMMPPPPIPRPRTGSNTRQARPVSIHGYSSLSSSSMQSGPPPSASAYYAYSQPFAPQAQPFLGSTPPTQLPAYPPISPVLSSPTSPSATYPGFPGYTGTFSARQLNPAVPVLDLPKQVTQPGLSRTLSARQRPTHRARGPMPGTFPDPESTESETDSASQSDSEYSYDEETNYRSDPRRRSRNREGMVALVPHPRRPSMSKKYFTEATVPTRARRESMPREALLRAPRSDTYVDYPSSSEVGDSDRTARAVIDRRSAVSSARSSRRPSVSTTASSGRTKATTMSSMTDHSGGRLIVEGRNGRRTAYLSKDEQAKLLRRYQQQQLEAQQLQEEKIAAYQKNLSGGDPYELTAENIRKANNRKSGSHISGRSQKSSGSDSKNSKPEGIQIRSGGTVLHVYGDAKIEMRPSEDGGPAQFVIASSNGRESEYRTSSKSSGSRVGRSRQRNDLARQQRDAIQENDYEDGYAVAR